VSSARRERRGFYDSLVTASPQTPTVVIMAAGEGTRMRSSLPKVLHPVCGRPMIAWSVRAAQQTGAGRVVVVVSPDRDLTPGLPEGTETVVQPRSDGTGGALRAALDVVREAQEVVVLSGDHPLITAEQIEALLATHREQGAVATLMTVEIDDPGSYGRVVRDADGAVERIVETKHPESVPDEILAIREINTGTYCFSGPELAGALTRLSDDNPAGEYLLPDVVPILRSDGGRIAAYKATDAAVNLGVNTRADLALATAEARWRILREHMLAGVTVVDPESTWIEADVAIEPDVVIEPGTYLRGATHLARGATVGPHSTLIDARIGERARVVHSYLVECEVGADCNVGPFAYLRPGTVLADGAKAGTFVEIKNSQVGEGAKVPHLSYLGDAEVGAGANLGASTITANYDGVRKHRTKIGEGARIGVHTSLVAPVAVGPDAYTGAGAIIRKDVPPGGLGLTDAKQRNIEGWAERKRRG
jgi:bifunctional UDP-N-acetylglucosamine pyrophosphorylase/glucosamine-1-phosphate N-acetyltransferase